MGGVRKAGGCDRAWTLRLSSVEGFSALSSLVRHAHASITIGEVEEIRQSKGQHTYQWYPPQFLDSLVVLLPLGDPFVGGLDELRPLLEAACLPCEEGGGVVLAVLGVDVVEGVVVERVRVVAA